MNSLIFIANILDPRYKLEFIQLSVQQMYGELSGSNLFDNIKTYLNLLFDDYVSIYGRSYAASEYGPSSQTSQSTQTNQLNLLPTPGNSISLMKNRFKKYKIKSRLGGSKRFDYTFV